MPTDYNKNDPYHRNIMEGPRSNMKEVKFRGLAAKHRQKERRRKREFRSHKRKKQREMR